MKKGEKIMNRLQQQKENKSGLLEDMLSFIRYTPNREADLLAFMEKYQKADCEERPAVLEQLRSCMDGKEYPASEFAYVPDPEKPSTWKLPIFDAHHVGGALAAMTSDYRGNPAEIPERDRKAVMENGI